MKKAKIMLSVIALVAVVGGALAFKAKSPVTIYRLNTEDKCVALISDDLKVSTSPIFAQSTDNATFVAPQNDASCNTTVYFEGE
jgi:hypothetical protein